MNKLKAFHKNITYDILVDSEDYEFLSQFTWYLSSREGKILNAFTRLPKGRNNPFTKKEYGEFAPGSKVYMHRLVLGINDKSMHVDHIDRNPLNNQKENIRTCTIAENNFNRMRERTIHDIPYKGVYMSDTRKNLKKPYIIKIGFEGYRISIDKSFETMEEAAYVYDLLAKKLHGEFASLNFPELSD